MSIVETTQSLNPSQLPKIQTNKIIKIPKMEKPSQNTPAPIDETGTTISNLNFLKKNLQEQTINNLNSQKEIQKDIKTSTLNKGENNSQKDKKGMEIKKKGFAGRAKNFVGNMWKSIKNFKLKNIFGITEYKEFRNCNGDIVKIPIKKIPLKKKKEISVLIKNKISQEQNRIVSTYNGISVGMYLVT